MAFVATTPIVVFCPFCTWLGLGVREKSSGVGELLAVGGTDAGNDDASVWVNNIPDNVHRDECRHSDPAFEIDDSASDSTSHGTTAAASNLADCGAGARTDTSFANRVATGDSRGKVTTLSSWTD